MFGSEAHVRRFRHQRARSFTQFAERAHRVPRFAMDADERLARSLQEEEDRAAAAELLRREASANAVTSHREDFARRLDGGVRTVLAYENAESRAAALAVIPVQRLKREADALVARAAEKAAAEARSNAEPGSGRTADSSRQKSVSHADALLLRLLRWFKREFFAWCDAPACGVCGCTDAPAFAGPGVPTPDEAKHGASRVETYTCASKTCGAAIRFPRYNDAVKLLATRAGRCGEWANCFTLCCRALGFEARWVLDWTDHVWTEVYSESQERWLHCDSCEDACDAPRMYEKGWGKKLSFVVAFGTEDVLDVTRRYVLDFEGQTLGVRRSVLPDRADEVWVADALAARRDALRAAPRDGEEKAIRALRLAARDAREEKELIDATVSASPDATISSPAENRDESRGRTTGSLAWRAARGELGELGELGRAGEVPEASETRARTPAATPADPVADWIRAEFARLTTRERMSPNEAAARALATARETFR